MDDESKLPSRLTPNQIEALALEKESGKRSSYQDIKSKKDKARIETQYRKLKKDDKKVDLIDKDLKDYTSRSVADLKEEPSEGTRIAAPSSYKPGQYKQRPVLNYINKLREKVFGSRIGTKDENELRKDLIKVGTQTVIVNKLLEANTETLHEVAKKDIELAKLLKRLGDPRVPELAKKVESGQEVYPEEAREIVGHLEDVAIGLDSVGVALKLEMPDVIQTVQDLINNNKLDLDSRRKVFSDLIKVLKDSKTDPKLLEEIRNTNIKSVNFTEKELDSLNAILDTLKATTIDEKIYGTIKELKQKLGSILLTQEDLNEFFEKEYAGKSAKESLVGKGLGAIPDQAKSGIINSLFAALGLPGLGQLLSSLGIDVVGLATKGISALGSLGGFLGGAGEGGVISGAIEGIESLLTKIPGISTVISEIAVFGSAITGFVSGIMATMDEWKNFFSGIFEFGKSLINLGGRLISGLEEAIPILKPIIEGLKEFAKFIFELPVKLIKLIFEGFKNIGGWIGVGAGKLGDLFKAGASFLDTVAPAATAAGPGGMAVPVPTTQGAVTPVTPAMDTSASTMATSLDHQERVNQAKMTDNTAKPMTVPVIVPQDKKGTQVSNRQHGVDDLSTALMNNGMINN